MSSLYQRQPGMYATRRVRGGYVKIVALVASMMFAGTAAGQATEGHADRSEADTAVAILESLEGQFITADFEDRPLGEVIEAISDMSRTPIHGDWSSLIDFAVDRRTRVTVRAQRSPLSTVLASLVLQISDSFSRAVVEVDHGRVVITTLGATARMRLVASYDVRDLLASADVADRLSETSLDLGVDDADEAAGSDEDEATADDNQQMTANDDDQSGGAVAAQSSDDNGQSIVESVDPDELEAGAEGVTPGEALMLRIIDHVDPEAWVEYGGDRAQIDEHNGVLLISASASIQKKIRTALRELRRAIPSGVVLEAAVVTIPRAEYTRLARRHRLGSAELARAILRSTHSATTWSADVLSVAFDQSVEAEALSDAGSMSLRVTPSFESHRGLLSLNVRGTITIDSSALRSIATTATCPGRNGSVIVELPAAMDAQDTDSMQLIVLIPYGV